MSRGAFWQNKSAIVTGASSGIGWALAEHLAQRGARLGLIARRREKLDELADKLRCTGATIAVAVADVESADQTAAAVAALERTLGPCDVAIANAGVHIYTPGPDFDAHEAATVIRTNVIGVINTLAAVMPGMVQRRDGQIVAVASIAAMLGLPWVAAYSASKSAVVTLMESLAVDLHTYGVKVTTICPGFIETPMIADHDPRVKKWVLTAPQAADRIARAIERGRRESWFPRRTWLAARIGRALPYWLYRHLVRNVPRPPSAQPRSDGLPTTAAPMSLVAAQAPARAATKE